MRICTSSGRCRAVDREFANVVFAQLSPKSFESMPWDHTEGSQSQPLGCLGPKMSLRAARVSPSRCST